MRCWHFKGGGYSYSIRSILCSLFHPPALSPCLPVFPKIIFQLSSPMQDFLLWWSQLYRPLLEHWATPDQQALPETWWPSRLETRASRRRRSCQPPWRPLPLRQLEPPAPLLQEPTLAFLRGMDVHRCWCLHPLPQILRGSCNPYQVLHI